jgi:ABC-type iron transport system FetAB permease component
MNKKLEEGASMDFESLSPNLQAAARLFSKMSKEEVISNMQDAKFVESLSLTAEELQAVHRYIEDSIKASPPDAVQDIWS